MNKTGIKQKEGSQSSKFYLNLKEVQIANLNMPSVTTDELRTVIALHDLPDEHLQWILDHGELHEYADGAMLSKTGQPIDLLWFMLEGKAMYYQDVNGRLIHYFTFENTPATGGAGGLLPYSRMKAAQGYTFASGYCRMFGLHKKHFPELEDLSPTLIQRLISYMTERARTFATFQLQQEKISALGKLSAGIAHELNNPASAITNIATELKKKLLLNYDLTENVMLQNISHEQVKQLNDLAISNILTTPTHHTLSAMQQFEMEDKISTWLEQNGIQDTRKITETFTDAGWTIPDFERLCDAVGHKTFLPILLWLENLITSAWLLKDLEDASTRISQLVGALKSHVHMDRTADMVPTNLHRDIDNTLTLLGYKLRQKNINVVKRYMDGLPGVDAYVGELNQVWSNIIDNAIFALDENGILTIETCMEGGDVWVRITDNGTGIPPDILPHIFEPYFTTKKAGDGSGIGLDTVDRVVKNHKGRIDVSSEPGRTAFSIYLPARLEKEGT